MDLPWRTTDRGRLEVQYGDPPIGEKRDPAATDEWIPMFPGLLQTGPDGEPAGLGELPEIGIMAALPLLIHGAGGGAAIHDASHRLNKLGIRTTLSLSLMRGVEPDPLLDLLRVQQLQSAGVLSAAAALRDFAREDRRDPFVRAAAAESLLRWPDFANAWDIEEREELKALAPPRSGVPGLHAGLQRLPDDADLVLGLDCTRVPPLGALHHAWRELAVRKASDIDLLGGGAIGPYSLATLQRFVDMPGQLPYELATHFGNWRVDHALFARLPGEADGYWFHLGGRFSVKSFAAGLEAANAADVTNDGSRVTGTLYGWRVEVSSTDLEASTLVEVDSDKRGRSMPRLQHRADPDQPPVWLSWAHKADTQQSSLPPFQLDITLNPKTAQLRGTATCRNQANATSLLGKWRDWKERRAFAPADRIAPGETMTWQDVEDAPAGVDESPKAALVWLTCIAAIDAAANQSTVSWSLDVSKHSTLELARLLRFPPAVFLTLATK